MNRIDQIFQSANKAFIPYITAGFPSVDETASIMHLLAANGADIIELGLPFSDPTADGKVIQASSQMALDRGLKLNDYFRIIESFRQTDQETPVVVFSYYNPIFHVGVEAFAARAKDAGADAFLIVDLPLEEQQEVRPALDKLGLHLIQLIAPTTPPERAERILAGASGFVYQISLKGVTGVRSSLPPDIAAHVAETKSMTSLPLAVGFGVAEAEQASAVAGVADGVVVGSALVKCIMDNQAGYREPLAALAGELAAATHAG